MRRPDAHRRTGALDLALALLLMGALAVAAACAAGAVARPLDTLGQFLAPALTTAALGVTLAHASGRRRMALALVAVALALAVEMTPQWLQPQARPAPGVRPVRVYFDNLWTRNGDGAAIRRSIATADADVVALVQVSGRNERSVEQALAAYPYRLEDRPVFDRHGPRRTVVASRYPLKAAAGAFVGAIQPGYPVEVGAPAPFRLVVVHLQRPWPYRGQDEHFAVLPQDLDGRTVMVGDFNATLSSAALGGFLRRSHLLALPARIGDWPSFLPAPLRLPIENVLASPNLAVFGRRFARPNGSDHRPIVFEVAPARQP